MSQAEWWKDPRGLVAAVTLLAVVFGLFWSREKLLWELTEKISDAHKETSNVGEYVKINERALSAIRDRIAENERRLQINAERILRMEGIIDRIYPQPNNHAPINSE